MNISKKEQLIHSHFSGRFAIEDQGTHYLLTGSAPTWADASGAAAMIAKKGSKKHVVNAVTVQDKPLTPMQLPAIKDSLLNGQKPDVLIIGGGIVGCAVARELSSKNLDILLVEKEYDVAVQTSSRNDGMIHPGIDIKPGLLKKKMNNIGNKMYDDLCDALQVPFHRTGQYLCFNKKWILPLLYLSLPYWRLTLPGKVKVISKKKLHRLEPGVSQEAECALFFASAGMVCPYGLTIAMAENAVDNGVQISLDTAVTAIDTENGKITCVHTNRGKIYPSLVINCAGVFAEDVAAMADDRFFSIHPRKGTNAILDKKARKNVNTIYSFIGTMSKTSHSKGGGIVGTAHGNVLIGPDAVETNEREDFTTHADSINQTFFKQQHAAPWLSKGDIITYFSGIRAATYEEDFIIEPGRNCENIIHAAGIQSPGLTAAPAIAVNVRDLAVEFLSRFKEITDNKNFSPKRTAIINPKTLSPAERDALIKQNPDYGQIVCRCEEVSKGEILDAMNRSLPCQTLDGIKRRVRPGMGRCQGGFCGPLITRLISEHFGTPLNDVRKAGAGSEILVGEKGGLQ